MKQPYSAESRSSRAHAVERRFDLDVERNRSDEGEAPVRVARATTPSASAVPEASTFTRFPKYSRLDRLQRARPASRRCSAVQSGSAWAGVPLRSATEYSKLFGVLTPPASA